MARRPIGLYPLLDVSILVMATERLSAVEQPIHDPLADAHHAIQCWRESGIV